jgi:hypothetical protein
MQEPISNKTFTGTACGTLLALTVSIDTGDIVKTAVMAATGALVSFCMTVFLKWLQERFK